ncbi:MAG: caspase family protein [Rhodocyclaceae bacterium]|nr:caspase family protein [Rhodocyclaceae bacterium]
MFRPDPFRRLTLQRLSALSAAALLPWRAGTAFATAASALNALPRTALVIGNGKYRNAPLPNPANDAGAIGERLARLGFKVVTQLDAGRDAMQNAVADYGEQLARHKGVGLFYFAGHGLQLAWRNFLVPVDANLTRADDVLLQTLDLRQLFDRLGKAGNAMNVIILDACRDNPFGSELKTGKGLSQMDAPIGTLLAYATAPGNLASDGSGDNGLYTEHLLREIGTPEAKIEDVFKRVRLAVRRASSGQQVPWESTSLEDDFYFIPPPDLKKLSQEELDRQFAEEAAEWDKVQAANAIKPVEDYLRRYPSGRFSELALVRLDRLLAKEGEKKVKLVNAAENPFTQGTGVIDLNFRVGDHYVYRGVDLLTQVETRRHINRITEITEDRVIFNNGALVTDLLGNIRKLPNGGTFGPSQYYIAEYSVGKKWTTRYDAVLPNGNKDAFEIDFKVVGRESITVPAGTFDCFRIEGNGWILAKGVRQEIRYWVTPAKLNRHIALEVLATRGGRIGRSERQELESYTRAG